MRFRIQRNLPLKARAFLNVIAAIPSSDTRKQKLISRVACTTPIPSHPKTMVQLAVNQTSSYC
jgi:hypothetical protein